MGMNLNDLKVQALPNTLKTIESYSHKMCPNDKLQSIFIYLWQSKRTQIPHGNPLNEQ